MGGWLLMWDTLNQMFSALSWCKISVALSDFYCSNGWRIIDSQLFLWSYYCWRLVVVILSKIEFTSKRSPAFDHSQLLMEIGSWMLVQKGLIRQMQSRGTSAMAGAAVNLLLSLLLLGSAFLSFAYADLASEGNKITGFQCRCWIN